MWPWHWTCGSSFVLIIYWFGNWSYKISNSVFDITEWNSKESAVFLACFCTRKMIHAQYSVLENVPNTQRRRVINPPQIKTEYQSETTTCWSTSCSFYTHKVWSRFYKMWFIKRRTWNTAFLIDSNTLFSWPLHDHMTVFISTTSTSALWQAATVLLALWRTSWLFTLGTLTTRLYTCAS